MVGRKLLHYRILDQIGAGGMGVVYRAQDERLDREVALKVLPAGELADDTARRRCREEALALSHLNHPNICTIHEVGEDEGQTFIVMEYVKGTPLSVIVRDGGLPTETIYRYGSQIADALAHAHERGVLHRDLKSANIMITPEGRVKVLDFGLAKRTCLGGPEAATQTQEALTAAGTVLGTLHYMAPETLRGEPADARSDIWALGAVLYEMAAGGLPFKGQTPFALSSAILHEPPAMLPACTPIGLRSVIQRCLEKEPGQRYQTAAEVRAVIEASPSTASAVVPLPASVGRSRWALAAAGALAVILAALAGLNFGRVRERIMGKPGPPRIESIAVLPLENFSHDPEQEFFADGMTEQLIADLSKIRALRVISRTSVMQYKGKSKPLPEIAKELNVDAVVEGSVLRSGDKVRITAQLLYAPKDQHLWAESYERDLRDVLAMQGEVARDVANQIRITVTPQEQTRLAGHPVDPEVHELYLKAQYSFNQDSVPDRKRAIDLFQQVVKKDANFAPAYAGLALSYAGLGRFYEEPHKVMPLAREAALKALSLDPTLSEAYTALATVKLQYDWDWAGAEQDAKRAIQLNHNSADAHDLYSAYYSALGNFKGALEEVQLAREVDPLSLRFADRFLYILVFFKDYDRAIAEAQTLLARNPDFVMAYAWKAMALMMQRRFPEALEAQKRANEIDPNPGMQVLLAVIQAAAGNKAEAEKLVHKIEDVAKRQYICNYEISQVYAGLGNRDQAMKWLKTGLGQRCDCMIWLQGEPWMEPLRADPRYLELIKSVGFPNPTAH